LAYNYWLIVIALLKVGIPYEAILSFSEQELHYVLGIQGAIDQREQDEAARQERLSAQQDTKRTSMF